MGKVLRIQPPSLAMQPPRGGQAVRPTAGPDAAARGILLALALSGAFWVALGPGMGFLA